MQGYILKIIPTKTQDLILKILTPQSFRSFFVFRGLQPGLLPGKAGDVFHQRKPLMDHVDKTPYQESGDQGAKAQAAEPVKKGQRKDQRHQDQAGIKQNLDAAEALFADLGNGADQAFSRNHQDTWGNLDAKAEGQDKASRQKGGKLGEKALGRKPEKQAHAQVDTKAEHQVYADL